MATLSDSMRETAVCFMLYRAHHLKKYSKLYKPQGKHQRSRQGEVFNLFKASPSRSLKGLLEPWEDLCGCKVTK